MTHGNNGNGHKKYFGTRVTMGTLPEAAQAALLQVRDDGAAAWGVIAATTIAVIENGGRAMDTYEAVAGLVGMAPRTVRDYSDTWRLCGDVAGEFPFCREHWRAMIPQARARVPEDLRRDLGAVRQALADVAAEWLATSERYGGVIVPPVVIWAHAAAERTPAEQYEAAVRSAQKALERAARFGNQLARERDDREVQLLDTALAAVGDLHDAVFVEIVDAGTGEAVQP